VRSLLLTGFVLLFACGGSDSGTASPNGGTSGSSGNASSGGPDDGGIGPTTPDPDGGAPYTGAARSCAQPNGGQTCGVDGKDDCCKTLPVPKPNAAFKLDKYSITAGRMRVFITATNGDVRGWIQAHRPDWFEPVWDSQLPIKMDSGEVTLGDNHLYDPGKGLDGVYQQLGPIHYGQAEQGGNEGCLTKEVGNARTYRLPDDVNTRLWGDTQEYPQDVTDKKPQQCTTFFMFAAFCAWDGGTLPTLDQLQYAWDAGDPTNPKHLYPWGGTPAPGGWSDAYDTQADATAFGKVTPKGSDQTVANYKYNFFEPAKMICLNNQATACDYTLYVAPPGRFPKGDGPFGHSDLAGDVYNVALPMTGTPGTDPTTRLVGLAKTGAFDNHAIPATHPVPPFNQWHPTNKYLAVGARCARPM
jgi:formylglycine-generating enzyme required for sulfatase activity